MWIPAIVFASLFGLSMDYEVFVLSRIREEYDRTGSTDEAIVGGLARTGRLVTCAALVLMVTFLSLSADPNQIIRIQTSTLAVGVIIDAVIIRTLLVPALVSLMGPLELVGARFRVWSARPTFRNRLAVTAGPHAARDPCQTLTRRSGIPHPHANVGRREAIWVRVCIDRVAVFQVRLSEIVMSAHYWISYQIYNDASCEDRTDAMLEAISDSAEGTWRETSAFYLIETSLDITALARRIKAAVDPARDKVIVRRLNSRSAVCIGRFHDLAELKVFMPYISRI